MNVIEELRALVLARTVLDREIEAGAVRALRAGEDRTCIAGALGMSRASLYRQFGGLIKEKEQVE